MKQIYFQTCFSDLEYLINWLSISESQDVKKSVFNQDMTMLTCTASACSEHGQMNVLTPDLPSMS